jgi:AraC-like DNA-binding protein
MLKGTRWQETVPFPPASSPAKAVLMPVCSPGPASPAGAVYGQGMFVDLQWHFHDMHKLLYAFEGGIEVESTRGRNLIPRQLAAWIPAGVPHCTSINGVRWVAVFFAGAMVPDGQQRVRTVMVSPLMREMMREAMRWPLTAEEYPLRAAFFEAMAQLCTEWITHEANLFLPTSNDQRVKRALDYTNQRRDMKVSDICSKAGISVRSLRRHLKDETGMTWEVYRQRSRLLEAVSLLSETEESIGEIAARCGFESPSGFTKVFRQEMGEAPRAYRHRVKESAPE